MARHAALETFGRSGNPVFGDKFNQSQGFVGSERMTLDAVSYTHLRAHETGAYLVCRLLLEKKNRG